MPTNCAPRRERDVGCGGWLALISLLLLKTIQVLLINLLLLLPSRENLLPPPLVLFHSSLVLLRLRKEFDVTLVCLLLGCHKRFGSLGPLLVRPASAVAGLAA